MIMKRFNWFLLAILFVLIPALQSCDDNDGYSVGDIGVGWATVRVLSGNAYYLDSDRYGTLWLSGNDVYWYKPVDGERVFVRFNPLWDNYEGYNLAVKLEGLRPILTKQVEELTSENEAEYGNDPVDIIQQNIWVSTGYLNVIYEQNIPLYKKHRVSLVRNTTVEPVEDGYVHLEYRYNTYDDVSDHWGQGVVSFNLNSLDMEGKKGIKLKLNSAVNGEVEIVLDIKGRSEVEDEVNFGGGNYLE